MTKCVCKVQYYKLIAKVNEWWNIASLVGKISFLPREIKEANNVCFVARDADENCPPQPEQLNRKEDQSSNRRLHSWDSGLRPSCWGHGMSLWSSSVLRHFKNDIVFSHVRLLLNVIVGRGRVVVMCVVIMRSCWVDVGWRHYRLGKFYFLVCMGSSPLQ